MMVVVVHNLSASIIIINIHSRICHPFTEKIAPAFRDTKKTFHKGCYHHLLTSAPLEIPNCSTYGCCNNNPDSSKHRYSWCASRFSCYTSSSICSGSLVFLLNVKVTYRCLRGRVGLLVWYSFCLPLCFLKTTVLPSLLFLCGLLLLGVVYLLCVSASNSNSYQNNNCKQLQHRLLLLNKKFMQSTTAARLLQLFCKRD